MEEGKSIVLPCPRCGKETKPEGNPFRPFCSRRCKLIDLGKWVEGEYVIPSQDDETETEDQE
ncbi:MAG: DNA gyrase inhibitor YacG [Deltaproteobacteria bacterium]|nr:DNA gyrase inhibitor YacG [Deltaproteobacteria bacterium]MBW2305305.1 DNA gyrase inhibitor YacG [Deltaproteobacteria bacterium]